MGIGLKGLFLGMVLSLFSLQPLRSKPLETKWLHQLRWDEVISRDFRLIYHQELQPVIPQFLPLLEEMILRLEDLFETRLPPRTPLVLHHLGNHFKRGEPLFDNSLFIPIGRDSSLSRTPFAIRNSGKALTRFFLGRLFGSPQPLENRSSRIGALPRWFEEGFGRYLFEYPDPLKEIELIEKLHRGIFPTLEGLSQPFGDSKEGELFSQMSLLFTRFLFQLPHAPPPNKFLRNLKQTAFFRSAIRDSFGRDIFTLFKEFKSSLKEKMGNFPNSPESFLKSHIPHFEGENPTLDPTDQGLFFLKNQEAFFYEFVNRRAIPLVKKVQPPLIPLNGGFYFLRKGSNQTGFNFEDVHFYSLERKNKEKITFDGLTHFFTPGLIERNLILIKNQNGVDEIFQLDLDTGEETPLVKGSLTLRFFKIFQLSQTSFIIEYQQDFENRRIGLLKKGLISPLTPQDRNAFDLCLQPENKGFLFVSQDREPGFQIYNQSLENGTLIQLTHENWLCKQPVFEPNSQFIFYSSLKKGKMWLKSKSFEPISPLAPPLSFLEEAILPPLLQKPLILRKTVEEPQKLLPEGYGKYELRWTRSHLGLLGNREEIQGAVHNHFTDPLLSHRLTLSLGGNYRAEEPYFNLEYKNHRESLWFEGKTFYQSRYRTRSGPDFTEIQRGVEGVLKAAIGRFSSLELGMGGEKRNFKSKNPTPPFTTGLNSYFVGGATLNTLDDSLLPSGIHSGWRSRFYEGVLQSDIQGQEHQFFTQFFLRIGQNGGQRLGFKFKGWEQNFGGQQPLYPLNSLGGIDELRSQPSLHYLTPRGMVGSLEYGFPTRLFPHLFEPLLFAEGTTLHLFLEGGDGENFRDFGELNKPLYGAGFEAKIDLNLLGRWPFLLRLGTGFPVNSPGSPVVFAHFENYFQKFL